MTSHRPTSTSSTLHIQFNFKFFYRRWQVFFNLLLLNLLGSERRTNKQPKEASRQMASDKNGLDISEVSNARNGYL